jgi:3-deoxy-D-manno-octulosonic-acid transferase
VIRPIYSAVMWALQPVLRRKLQQRGRQEPGYLQAVDERFGHYIHAVHQPSPEQLTVWIHAVSLGETRAAKILLEALRHAYPTMRLVLTHGTATGREAGQALLRDGDVQVWQPWDTPAVVQRFLQHVQPDVGILLETEVWPNWVAQCQQRNIPLLLINARMSAKSLRQSLRLKPLAVPTYAGLTAVLAQSHDDQLRLQQLGAHVLGAFGNLKFDARPDPAQLALALQWRKSLTRPVVLLASAREGEEDMWLDAMQALHDLQNTEAVHWLIVPRHPQRFDVVAQSLAQRGWQVSRRSQWGEAGPTEGDAQPTVWLGDSLGEMSLYYELADVALLGGSFAPLGGQNLIEATACGCPVVMGPHTFNFTEAADLAEQAGAAIRVADMAQAVTMALHLAESAQEENVHVQACLTFSEQHRGAAQRTVQALKPWLVKAPTAR